MGGGKPYFQNLTKTFIKLGISQAMINIIPNQLRLETNFVGCKKISKNYFEIFGLHTLGIEPDDTWMFGNSNMAYPPPNRFLVWQVPDMTEPWNFISEWLWSMLSQNFDIFPWRFKNQNIRPLPKNLYFVQILIIWIQQVCA